MNKMLGCHLTFHSKYKCMSLSKYPNKSLAGISTSRTLLFPRQIPKCMYECVPRACMCVCVRVCVHIYT